MLLVLQFQYSIVNNSSLAQGYSLDILYIVVKLKMFSIEFKACDILCYDFKSD